MAIRPLRDNSTDELRPDGLEGFPTMNDAVEYLEMAASADRRTSLAAGERISERHDHA